MDPPRTVADMPTIVLEPAAPVVRPPTLTKAQEMAFAPAEQGFGEPVTAQVVSVEEGGLQAPITAQVVSVEQMGTHAPVTARVVAADIFIALRQPLWRLEAGEHIHARSFFSS